MHSGKRLPALAHPYYRRYLIGAFISNVGNMLQTTAIVLHVYNLTGSSLMVGMLGLVRVVPLVLFTLIGGIVADHHDRRIVVLLAQSVMAFIALMLAVFEATGLTSVWLIYGMVAIFSVARAFEGPSRQALVPNLVPPDVLPNAIGLNGISWRLSDVLGPVGAGLIITSGGILPFGPYGTCYIINVVTFFAVFAALLTIPSKRPEEGGSRIRNLAELKKALRDGLQYVRRNPVLRSTMWIDFWATFFSSADALIPAFAKSILDVGDLGAGLMQGSIAVGALIGAMLMTWLPTVRHQGRWVIWMIALYGVCTVGFGFSPNIAVAMVFLAGTGFADMISTVLRQTIRQLVTPDHMRGRMSATSMLFNISGPQLGDFEAGAVAAGIGERWSVAVGGFACMFVAGHWARSSKLPEYEHEASHEEILEAQPQKSPHGD